MDLVNLEPNSSNNAFEVSNSYLQAPIVSETENIPLLGQSSPSLVAIEAKNIYLDNQFDRALNLVNTSLEEFVASDNFEAGMETAFGIKGTTLAAKAIVNDLISQTQQPEIKLYNGQDLGANGAYVAQSDTIYLAVDLLTGQPETAARTLVEEIGHYLDNKIDGKDAAGDEGQIFAAQVFGDTLSAGELAELKADNETAVRFIDGELVTVEQNSIHLRYGNPSGATRSTYSDYFLEKSQYALSYDSNTGTANWVSWQLNSSWLGSARRQNDFRADFSLPSVFYRVDGDDYRGSGYDRGHLVASADRTRTTTDNSATFYMSNMIPQAPDNNQGPWREFEEFTRNLVNQGKELYIVAGGVGSLGAIANGNVTIPAYTWKTVLILDRPGASVTQNTQTIGIYMPNTNGIRNRDWRDYIVSVDTIESRTGYNFYSLIPDFTESQIESRVYGSSSGGGSSGSSSSLSISSLLPNPSGNEYYDEEAEIVNNGFSSVSLSGWRLTDASGGTWSLSGTLGTNRSINFRRNGQSMSLNNSGDTIQLIDPFGRVVDTVSYGSASTNQVIRF